MDNYLIQYYELNVKNILNHFVLGEIFGGYNFGKIVEIIPSVFNLIIINIDYYINGEQTASIFLIFYLICYLNYFALFKKLKLTILRNILYSGFLSTSCILICNINLGFNNITYILIFFPFLIGWCLGKFNIYYLYFYFLLSQGSPAIFLFSIFYATIFRQNRNFLDIIKTILPSLSIFIILFVFEDTYGALSYAKDKNVKEIFLSNTPILSFFNLGFFDRSTQILKINSYLILIVLTYLYFYRDIVLSIIKKEISYKSKIAFFLFILTIVYMMIGNIIPDTYNKLYKTIPGLIIFRGQYLFNIFIFYFFIYFFIESKNNLKKIIFVVTNLIFQILTIILIYFSSNYLDGRLKNIHTSDYDYFSSLQKSSLHNDLNLFLPLVSSNDIYENKNNIRTGSGYNYIFNTINPYIINNDLKNNSYQDIAKKYNIKNIILVKKDINLKTKNLPFTYFEKKFEDDDYIIYYNKQYVGNVRCKILSLEYYNCINNILQKQSINNKVKINETTNYFIVHERLIWIFHIISLFSILFLLFLIIKIFFTNLDEKIT